MSNECSWCGKTIKNGSGYLRLGTGWFCSKACEVAYRENQKEEEEAKREKKAQKAEFKAQKITAKAEAKEIKRNNALQTSAESLATVKKLCFIGGLFAAHRYYVGKVKSALCINAWLLLSLYILFFGDWQQGLIFLAISFLIWFIDILRIVFRKFTDKYGYTIKNNS